MTCTLCALHQGVKSVCIECEGVADNRLMLIGEAPGAREDALGRSFVGDAGGVLNRILTRVCISRDETAIRNAVCCRPTTGSPPKNRTPQMSEIQACRQYTVEDIRRLKPLVVVLMGNVALSSVLDMKGITRVRGSVLESSEFPGVYFIPTIHPAAALRRWEDEKFIAHDLRKAWKICKAGEYKTTEVDYRVCQTVEEVENLLNRLEATTDDDDYVAVDTETTGLDCHVDKIVCVSLSNRAGTGWVIPLHGYEMREIWTGEQLESIIFLLKEFLEGAIKKAMQNGVFDLLMLRRNLGIEVENWVLDPMLLHHAVDENQPHSLEFLCEWYTDVPSYKNIPGLYKPGGAANVKEEDLWSYAAADADVTYRVAHELELEAEADGTRIVHDRIMIPFAEVMADAEDYGVRIDLEKLEAFQKEYMKKRETLQTEIYEEAGMEFNTGSPMQVARILYDVLGLPVLKRNKATKTNPEGSRCTDAETLGELSKEHPMAMQLVELSKISHDIKTYLKGLDGKTGMLKFIGKDGRVHPRWMLHRAVTGRIASADPNVQAIKRPRENQLDFRALFAATEGWVIIAGDYKAAEARVIGYVAGDEALMKIFEEDRDIHRIVGSQMFHCPPEEVTPKQRDQAKGVVFGLNYGRGPYTLAAEFGISLDKAQAYIDSYFELFKQVKAYFEITQKMVDEDGVVITPFGRKRHLYGAATLKESIRLRRFNDHIIRDFTRALNEMYRQAQNMTVQSTASDILCLASIRIHERLPQEGLRGRLLISHHDAWIGECPEDELEENLVIIKEELERTVPEVSDISLPVEFKIGRYWGDKSIKIKGF